VLLTVAVLMKGFDQFSDGNVEFMSPYDYDSNNRKPIRAALYDDRGTSDSKWQVAMVLGEAIGKHLLKVDLIPANIELIQNKLSVENFDVVIFPGGGGVGEADAITEAGKKRVVEFVKQGGGYIGICAGAYLATHEHLGLINAGYKEPWERGDGDVEMVLTDQGREDLRLPNAFGEIKVFYGGGPILIPQHAPDLPEYTTLAFYTSEIHSVNSNMTRDQMMGGPAIVTSEFGKGRVLLSSPHAELAKPPLVELLAHFILWSAKRL